MAVFQKTQDGIRFLFHSSKAFKLWLQERPAPGTSQDKQNTGQSEDSAAVAAPGSQIPGAPGHDAGQQKSDRTGEDLALPHDDPPARAPQQPETIARALRQQQPQHRQQAKRHVRRLREQAPDPVGKIRRRPPAVTDALHAEPGIDADQEILDPLCTMIGQDLQNNMGKIGQAEYQQGRLEKSFAAGGRQAGEHHGPPEQEAERHDEPAGKPQPDSRRDVVGHPLEAQPGRKNAATEQGRP